MTSWLIRALADAKVGAWVAGGAIAVSLLATGCSQHKQEAVKLANQGAILIDSNPSEAIGKFEEAVKLDPDNHQILYMLATAYRKREDWEKVASALRRAAEKAPEYANYWADLGWATQRLAEKGEAKWQEVVEPFQKCIEKDPNRDECYAQLAHAYLWSDDEQKALQTYTEAIEKRPTSSDPLCLNDANALCPTGYYTRLANLYMRLDYFKEAEQVLNAAKEMANPKDKRLYHVHTLLAEVHKERGDVEKEVAALESAKAVSEDDAGLLFNLGMAYAKLNPPKKAEALARLKGFTGRACRSKNAAERYGKECEQAQTMVSRLQGPGG